MYGMIQIDHNLGCLYLLVTQGISTRIPLHTFHISSFFMWPHTMNLSTLFPFPCQPDKGHYCDIYALKKAMLDTYITFKAMLKFRQITHFHRIL